MAYHRRPEQVAEFRTYYRWTIPLKELARIDPAVLSAFADELAGFHCFPDQLDNGPQSGTSAGNAPDRASGLTPVAPSRLAHAIRYIEAARRRR